jgi:hypothetical protein
MEWTSKKHFCEATQELLSQEKALEIEEQSNIIAGAKLDALEKRGICLGRLEVFTSLQYLR